MRTRLRISTVVAAVAVSVGVLELGEARAVSTAAISCGMVVTTDITVSNNISCSGDDGLVVGASNITIDLNGHLIDGDDTGDNGIDNTGGFDNVTIMNGRITDWPEGVDIGGNADGNQIIGLEIRSCTGDAIDLSTLEDGAVITNNRLVGNGGGLELDGNGHKVENNRMVSNTGLGMRITGDSNKVVKNTITLNGSDGIWIISAANTNKIEQNVIARNADSGIRLEGDDVDGNTLKGNRSMRNGISGVIVIDGDGNVVDSNILADNVNQGVILFGASSNVVKKNEAIGNTGGGILVDATSNSNTIDANVASGNSNDGVTVETAAPTNLVEKNAAYGNNDQGIQATSAIDGGGNKAAGNVNATQCTGVACS